jgi:hypothetical protein
VMIQIGIASEAIAGTWPRSQNVAASAASPAPQAERARSNPVGEASGAAFARRARLADAFVVTAGRVVAGEPDVAAGGPPPGRFARLALPTLALILPTGLAEAGDRRSGSGESIPARVPARPAAERVLRDLRAAGPRVADSRQADPRGGR